MSRLLGVAIWAVGILLATAPIVTAIGEAGCGGCYGKSCLCPDGTTQPTTNAPCGCGVACEGHTNPPNDATTDVSDAPDDVASDAPADVSTEGGGLGQGSLCNIQVDMCGPGLKCCKIGRAHV